jgi:hypothetical protein
MSTEEIPAKYHAAITSNRGGLTTLRACFAEFMRHFSPRAAASAFVVVLIFRLYLGGFTWHDAIVPVVLIALQPFVEWFIHRYILHLKPMTVFGLRIDLYGARQHRDHHRRPADLDRVLLKPAEIVQFLVEIAILAPLITWAFVAVTGGDLLRVSTTAIALSFLGLYRYEWSHFLIHTPYVPRSRWYRNIWRNHRLHHFKHEDYWMGVSSNLGDRVLGTNPDQATIARSPTARTLGVDV